MIAYFVLLLQYQSSSVLVDSLKLIILQHQVLFASMKKKNFYSCSFFLKAYLCWTNIRWFDVDFKPFKMFRSLNYWFIICIFSKWVQFSQPLHAEIHWNLLEEIERSSSVAYEDLFQLTFSKLVVFFFLLHFRTIVWLSTRIAIFLWRTTTIGCQNMLAVILFFFLFLVRRK